MIKLAVFDFDSTLMDGESIDILAKAYGVEEKVKAITAQAMAGELDFFESLNLRASYLKGMDEKLADEVFKNLPLMNGSKELIHALKQKNIKVAVFSGGFQIGLDYANRILHFDASFGNFLHAKDGLLTGKVGGHMMSCNSKGEMMQKIQVLLNVFPEETMAVGDGANDISMFAHANFKVAFCAKEILKSHANIIIDKKDLREIIPYIN